MKIAEIVVYESDSFQKAMRIIDASAGGVALLTDPDSGRLLRVVTDGDMRRGIIAGEKPDSLLKVLPQQVPITVRQKSSLEEVRYLMRENTIKHIPIVDEAGVPVGLYRQDELEKNVLLSPPHLGTQEMAYITEAIETNWVAPAGPNLNAFEKEFCEVVGSKAAAAVSSGTAALHLALIVSGIQAGDRIACSTFTFVASVNPILYLGGEPVFIDSESDGWNMCPESLKQAFEEGEQSGRPLRAVIVVNLYGQSSRMGPIVDLCEHYGAVLIEDSAEALGATYYGKSSGTFGKFGVFSFNGNKIITTSGGGMLVSDDEEAIERSRFLATQAKEPVPYYQHETIGFNYRLSNLLAGIGRAQLALLPDRVESRRAIFARYRSGLEELPIEWMSEIAGAYSTRWLSVGCFFATENIDIDAFIEQLTKRGIEARHVWKPMHQQPAFKKYSYFSVNENDLAGSLFKRGICFPSGSSLTSGQQSRVIREVLDVYTKP